MKVSSDAKVDWSYLVRSDSGEDKNWKMNYIQLFDCFENCERNDKR